MDAGEGLDASAPEGGLLLGRCLLASGLDCGTADDRGATFVPVGPGVDVPMVPGTQGFSMFVLAVRTSGIAPGLASTVGSPENPLVHVEAFDETDLLVAEYTGRAGFSVRTSPAGALDAAGLYTIVALSDPSTLDGKTLRVVTTVTDIVGEVRTGETSFVARAF